jgi:hypothetical protein
MPPNMMKALVGSRLNVIGSSSATVKAGPMPGSTPTAVPSVTPTSAHSRCAHDNALANPSRSSSIVCTGGYSHPASSPAGSDK